MRPSHNTKNWSSLSPNQPTLKKNANVNCSLWRDSGSVVVTGKHRCLALADPGSVPGHVMGQLSPASTSVAENEEKRAQVPSVAAHLGLVPSFLITPSPGGDQTLIYQVKNLLGRYILKSNLKECPRKCVKNILKIGRNWCILSLQNAFKLILLQNKSK